jgi:hypothetical protein
MQKRCFKCGEEKPRSEFYKHKGMGDGLLGKCKECTKEDATRHRNNNLDRIREYDRDRGNRQTPEYLRDLRTRHPQQYKAQNSVNNAVRNGRMKREKVCQVCSGRGKIHAHHDDYSFPLSVRWLCAACHSQWHRDNGEGLNNGF